jgi:hypothetical protein
MTMQPNVIILWLSLVIYLVVEFHNGLVIILIMCINAHIIIHM